MSRRTLSVLALLALLGLTAANLLVAEGAAVVAGLAVLKMAVIGAVFLELDRAHPAWAALAAGVLVALGGGTALLIGA